jgi:hypothetical protein
VDVGGLALGFRLRSALWLDAYLARASSYDADDIAKVIEQRPRPSYDERKAVFSSTGRPEPSRDPFPIVAKGGGRPNF